MVWYAPIKAAPYIKYIHMLQIHEQMCTAIHMVSSPQHPDQKVTEGAFHTRKSAEYSSSSGSKVKNIWRETITPAKAFIM
jgi:hypothetical protein